MSDLYSNQIPVSYKDLKYNNWYWVEINNGGWYPIFYNCENEVLFGGNLVDPVTFKYFRIFKAVLPNSKKD
jgi:hypothetical protein